MVLIIIKHLQINVNQQPHHRPNVLNVHILIHHLIPHLLHHQQIQILYRKKFHVKTFLIIKVIVPSEIHVHTIMDQIFFRLNNKIIIHHINNMKTHHHHIINTIQKYRIINIIHISL
jgi:hypothetical protein